jgi:PAS domain S-box-containing protein
MPDMADSVTEQISVLHVDDDPAFADLTATPLEEEYECFTVETATTADGGLNRIRDRRPDCVVSEYDMPGLNGIEFLRAVRRSHPHLPFVLFTSGGSEAVASDAIAAGVTDYLPRKPDAEQYDLLADRIRNAVRGRRAVQRAPREEELMRLTEFVGDSGGFELDPDTGEIRLTDGARRVLGLSDSDRSVPRNWLGLFHPDDRGDVQRALDRTEEIGEETRETWRYQPPDGEESLLEVTLAPVTTGGDTTTVRGAVRDITDRRERERELEQIETLFEHAHDALFLVRVSGGFRVERVNPAWEEATGLSADQVRGQTPQELLGDQQGEVVEARYRECVERRDTLQYDEQLQFGEEATHWETRIAPVVLGDTVEYIAGATLDVTEQVEHRRELERQNERLEEFASIVSHDLRNPLNTAELGVQLAQQECESPHLEEIQEGIDRSLRLIDDLLSLARGGERVVDPRPVTLADAVSDAWERVEAANATLSLETELAVHADRDRFRQLLLNLLDNALDHGGADVTVTVGETDGGFYLEDDGPGIPEAERENVFDAGYSTAEGGTGFGLRIVRQVADSHGWTVAVTDATGGGARFEITGVDTRTVGRD